MQTKLEPKLFAFLREGYTGKDFFSDHIAGVKPEQLIVP